MTPEQTVSFAEKALTDELYTSAIYDKLAAYYKDQVLRKKLKELARVEGDHAEFWKSFLKKRAVDTGGLVVSRLKILFLAFVYRLLGVGLSLKLLERGEHDAISHYAAMLKSPEISGEEKRVINQILVDELGHEEEFEEYLSKFRFFIDKVAVIFTQMSGGLVTVLSVTTGLAGAYNEPITAAMAGLLVGIVESLNTATGFYFFGKAEKQVKQSIIDRVKTAANSVPDVFSQRIIKYMRRKDFSEETAKAIAKEAAKNKELLGKIIAEEEYRIGDELGSPSSTAFYAGLFRIFGTALPLMPYFLKLPLALALPVSIIITTLTLVVTGFFVAVSAEEGIKERIWELTVNGLVLTALTFLIGKAAATVMTALA